MQTLTVNMIYPCVIRLVKYDIKIRYNKVNFHTM